MIFAPNPNISPKWVSDFDFVRNKDKWSRKRAKLKIYIIKSSNIQNGPIANRSLSNRHRNLTALYFFFDPHLPNHTTLTKRPPLQLMQLMMLM